MHPTWFSNLKSHKSRGDGNLKIQALYTDQLSYIAEAIYLKKYMTYPPLFEL